MKRAWIILAWFVSIALQLAFSTASAQADPLTFGFSDNALSGSPGDTVTFQGTFTNNTDSPAFLASVSLNFQSVNPDPDFTLTDCSTVPTCPDDNWFFAVSGLGASPSSSGVVDLFQITIPSDFYVSDYGTYYGTYFVKDGDGNPLVESATFSLAVGTSDLAAPEPASGLLLIAGLACLPRRKRYSLPR